CVCGKKIGPDPRNFNQRVSLGRNDLLIRTFPSRPEQIEENVKALDNLHFSPEELAQIDKHVADGQLNLWQASSDK
ncbi:hypothetical protein ACXNAM_18930, partial [Kluyvera cryocrescens]